jgi:predicted DNA-binding transcriptional regulator YafY
MNEQAKMQRLLRLLMLLNGKRWYTRRDIFERLGIEERTFYRYRKTLEEAGFLVEVCDRGYRLATEGRKRAGSLLHFTEEEASLLYSTLCQLQGEGPTKERLLLKLHTLYDCHILAKPARQHALQMAAQLQEAIAQQRQCYLIGYMSNHSGRIGNRLVEPFEFGEGNEVIWCYEPASQRNKQFKLSRMQAVEILASPWQYSDRHEVLFTDVFGFAAPEPIGEALVWLSDKAARLLQEDYPSAARYLFPRQPGYLFKPPVASWIGIGRFVNGLRDQVQVEGPEAFIRYLSTTFDYKANKSV